MFFSPKLIATCLGLAIILGGGPMAQAAQQQRPDILIILVDDLAFTDLGVFGGEIATPNLDKLAARGRRLTQMLSAPTCSPTRAALLTGTDPHWAGMGTLPGSQVEEQRGQPGYEGALNDRVVTFAQALQRSGYQTFVSGKWHLGKVPDALPPVRGFSRSLVMQEGSGNHYFDPNFERPEAKSTYLEDGRAFVPPVGAFSTDFFTGKMLRYLDEADPARPIFAYLPLTAPHWPLQAPEALQAKYRGRYNDGPLALAHRRLAGAIKAGVVAPGTELPRFEDMPDWAAMTQDARAVEAAKMEAYAAMVEGLDQATGDVLKRLQKLGRLENTLIFFLSDNGAEGIRLDASPFQGKAFLEWLARTVDNSASNIGRSNSFTWLGPAWAQATGVPFKLYKAFPLEGGIRVPAIVAGPGVTGAGTVSTAPLLVSDIAATILDVAGLRPETTLAPGQAGKMTGRSLVKFLNSGQAADVRSSDEPLGFEQFFRRALRKGDWKAVYIPTGRRLYYDPDGKQGHWELFNLARDPAENEDLCHQHPGKLKELIEDWDHYADDQGVVRRPALAPLSGCRAP